MKYLKKLCTHIITIVIAGLTLPLSAQSFKDRLMEMRKQYAAIEIVHLTMSIQVYENTESLSPYYNEVADIKRHFENYYYQFGTIDMLMNSKYLVMVDNDSREILCSKRSLKAEREIFSDPFKANIDSILNLYENSRLVEKVGTVEHYSLDQKKGIIRRIDLFIDEAENVLTRMEYRYRDGHFVAIQFNVFDKAPDFDADTFQENRYVLLEKGKLKAAKKFAGYNVVEVDGK